MSTKIFQGCEVGERCRKLGVNYLDITDTETGETLDYYACTYCTADLEDNERFEIVEREDD